MMEHEDCVESGNQNKADQQSAREQQDLTRHFGEEHIERTAYSEEEEEQRQFQQVFETAGINSKGRN